MPTPAAAAADPATARSRRWSRASALHLCTVLPTLLVACAGADSAGGPSGEPRGVTDDEIVIGTWAPLTGPAAAWGATARGTETYFAWINEQGGVHGRRLRLIVRDDGYQPARTVSAVREMVERDRVFAFVGGVGTATGRAVLDYIVEHEVPWIAPASGATYWAYPPKRTVFARTAPYFDEAAVLVDYAVTELALRTVAVAYQNDDYGRSGLVGARLALAGHGLEIVEELPVEVGDADLAAHAVRLDASAADAVLMWLTPRHATILVGAAERLDFEPQWLASSALADVPVMTELTGGAWAGTVYAGMQSLSVEGDARLEAYRRAAARLAPSGVRQDDFFLSGFRYAEPLVEALRRAGPDLTTDALIAALESFDGWEGIGAPLTYGPDRRQGSRAVFIARATEAGVAERITGWIDSEIDLDEAQRMLESGR